MMKPRRVVVTGMGVVSPIGNSLETFRDALFEGKSGIGPIQSFQFPNFPVKDAFEVKAYNSRKLGTHILDPFIQYAVGATDEALTKANMDLSAVDAYRVGISVSSSKGGVHTVDRFKERFERNPSAILGARIFTSTVPNYAAQWVARRWKVKGPAKCYVAACATGSVAVIEGARMVSEGEVDYCLAGSSDASITPLMLAGYQNMKVLAKEMRPFDKYRQGFLVGEGAGILFLETLESAKARGAHIYGEVLGSSYTNDPFDRVRFDPKGDTLAHGIQLLLKNTKIQLEEIDYINLHGTGTREGDAYETRQVKQALGARAQQIPMSATKSMTGHMLGASGAVEAIACLLAIKEQKIPPTINLECPDPELDLDYVALKSRRSKIKTTVSLSMGFGGHVATLALREAT